MNAKSILTAIAIGVVVQLITHQLTKPKVEQ